MERSATARYAGWESIAQVPMNPGRALHTAFLVAVWLSLAPAGYYLAQCVPGAGPSYQGGSVLYWRHQIQRYDSMFGRPAPWPERLLTVAGLQPSWPWPTVSGRSEVGP